jgi:hypothetical protein
MTDEPIFDAPLEKIRRLRKLREHVAHARVDAFGDLLWMGPDGGACYSAKDRENTVLTLTRSDGSPELVHMIVGVNPDCLR